jgi:hypothetical protein
MSGKSFEHYSDGAFSGKVKGKSPFPTLEDAKREVRRTPRVWHNGEKIKW